MHNFQTLKRAAKNPSSDLPEVRLALVGDTATGLLATALRGEAALRGLRLNLYEADYDTSERELFSADSPLRAHDAQYVVVYRSVQKFAQRHTDRSATDRQRLADEELAFYEALTADTYFAQRTLIVLNLPLMDDGVYGSMALSVAASLPAQILDVNHGLSQLAQHAHHLTICDLASVAASVGASFHDTRLYTTSEIAISPVALPLLSERLLNIVAVRRGTLRKVLVADLDNTLWGGTLSEDGIGGLQIGHALGIGRAFANVQRWVKKLVARGVVLCVVSKNDDAPARQAFAEHPDMVLRPDDVAVFLANWETKADNILHLSEILHIGTDQMVFLDDSPFERGMVRQGVTGICVPELPDDPAQWVDFLAAQHLFDTATLSAADAERTRQYRQEAERHALCRQFAGEDDYLAALNMRATVEPLTPMNLPRVAQLTQRSNQFNLRTQRYTAEQLTPYVASNTTHTTHETMLLPLCFSLADNYGSHGMVSVVFLQPINPDTVFINTWLMSCRVLRRGMEWFVANTMVETARRKGYNVLLAAYVPTKKNEMVRTLLPDLGFTPYKPHDESRFAPPIPEAIAPTEYYRLDIRQYVPKSCHIQAER